VNGAYTGLHTYYAPLVGALGWVILFTGPLLHYVGMLASHVAVDAADSDVSATSVTSDTSAVSVTSEEQLASRVRARALWQRVIDDACRRVAVCVGVSTLVDVCVAGVFSAISVALRHHLFVWSVVSPKYVYVVGGASVALCKLLLAALLLLALRRAADALPLPHALVKQRRE
jgi:hypothetical protein